MNYKIICNFVMGQYFKTKFLLIEDCWLTYKEVYKLWDINLIKV